MLLERTHLLQVDCYNVAQSELKLGFSLGFLSTFPSQNPVTLSGCHIDLLFKTCRSAILLETMCLVITWKVNCISIHVIILPRDNRSRETTCFTIQSQICSYWTIGVTGRWNYSGGLHAKCQLIHVLFYPKRLRTFNMQLLCFKFSHGQGSRIQKILYLLL